MFIVLLIVLLAAASVHTSRLPDRSRARVGEIFLLYLLVGYCGGPGLALSVYSLVDGAVVANWLGVPAGNPVQVFFAWAYLGMSIAALLALRYRGTYLIGPGVAWGVYFVGATFVHAGEFHAPGAHPDVHALLAIFVTHTLIGLLVLGALWMSQSEPARPV